MSVYTEFRKFGEYKFKYHGYFDTKKKAQETAIRIRQGNRLARVVKSMHGYEVWTHNPH